MSNQNDTAKNIGLVALGCGLALLIPFVLLTIVPLIFFPLFLSGLQSSLKELGNELEAQQTLSEISQAQEDYFAKNNHFASQISELKLEITPETDNYKYGMNVIKNNQSVKITATAKNEELSSYTGGVFAIKIEGNDKPVIISELCVTDDASLTPPEMPKLVGIKTECPPGSSSSSWFTSDSDSSSDY